jgi:heme oxygenase
MSLKEITKDLHELAESTNFMKAVFNGTLDPDAWLDFTYQKTLFYHTIEGAAASCGLLRDLTGIHCAFKLNQDYLAMNTKNKKHYFKDVVVQYHNYLLSINKNPDAVMAHVYAWHMGDLYGGQMIKRIIPGSHTAMDFENKDELIVKIRAKLNDETMGQEARCAFEWAIRILKEYDNTAVGTSS